MQNIYDTFEFDRIRSEIADNCKTEKGKYLASNLMMFNSRSELEIALKELNETKDIISRFGVIPIHTSLDALRIIDIAKKTAMLTPKDLEAIANDVITCNKVNQFFLKVDVDIPLIRKKTDSLSDLSTLEIEIHKKISSSLTIFDNATNTLSLIRKRIRKLEADVLSKGSSLALTYQTYLNDENPTLRDGHFVLPVKTAYKSKVNGIIYDISDTGNTTFIEPLEMVNLNNEIVSLKLEENEEVRKILKELTMMVLLRDDEIIHNNEVIAELDFLSAKIKYLQDNNGIIANLSNKQEISLVDTRHPLISKSKVIANSYFANEDKRIVIISGPNAGGKTISLKTIGLSILMNQCALPILAKKATLGYFNNIYIDIGDNQSLSDNLSTFSAHISALTAITNIAKGRDLVLLDELGTGTDPKEGQVIALAVTKYLEKCHSVCFISSHFSNLKEYAFTNPSLENSSMIFDEENLKPTYIFKSGVPGKSYALEVAERFGLNKEIILEAKHLLEDSDSIDTAKLIKSLQDKVRENVLLNEELTKKEKELVSLEKALRNKEKLIKDKKAHLLESVKEEKEALINDTNEKLTEIISKLSNSDLKLHEVIELKKQVDALKEEEKEIEYHEDIKVNDYVYSPSFDIEGKVISISGTKARISSKGISVDIPLNKLTHKDMPVIIDRNLTKKEHIKVDPNIRMELNIIGLHVDEARNVLAKYMDDVLLHAFSQVKIIHGFGSGALRKMVQTYISSLGYSYRAGGEYEGGSGATIVKLK